MANEILVILCISLSCFRFSDLTTPENIASSSFSVSVNVPKSNSSENVDFQEILQGFDELYKVGNYSVPVQERRRGKPIRNIIFGIYKNYKSTFLGNKTSSKYRKINRKHWQSAAKNVTALQDSDNSGTILRTKKRKKKRRKTAETPKSALYTYDGEYRYNFGTGVNITLDMKRDIVNVNLDEDCLRDVLTGFSLEDSDEEGRKEQNNKKYEMISKVLPLFILPFLIQSALIPFIVAKLKLLLIKSIIVGKLAIFLLVVSAIKNNQKMNNYESSPSYWAWEPSRRSGSFQGYKVEGRPLWVS